MLASDDNNPNFSGARNPDDLLNVTFYPKAVKDNFNSEKEGRDIFVDVTYIRLITPGNVLNIIERPIRPDDKFRFPRQWAMYQSANDSNHPAFGTPLEKWNELSPARAEELKYLKFRTVEQIANASDHQLQVIGMDGNMLKQKAVDFINGSRAVAADVKANEIVAKQAAEIEQLKDMVARMNEMMEKMQTKPAETVIKEKRKYTKRQKEEVQPEATN